MNGLLTRGILFSKGFNRNERFLSFSCNLSGISKRFKSNAVVKGPKKILISKSMDLNQIESILNEMTRNKKEEIKSQAHSHLASSLFRLGKLEEAMEILSKMRNNGYVPHRETFICWAYCCSKLKNLDNTHDLFNELNLNGQGPPPVVIHKHLIKNVIIAMIKSGDKQTAQILLINYCSIFTPNDEIFELMLNYSTNENEVEDVVGLMVAFRHNWGPRVWSSLINTFHRIGQDKSICHELAMEAFQKGSIEVQWEMLKSGALFRGEISDKLDQVLFLAISNNNSMIEKSKRKFLGNQKLSSIIHQLGKKKDSQKILNFWNIVKNHFLKNYPGKGVYKSIVLTTSQCGDYQNALSQLVLMQRMKWTISSKEYDKMINACKDSTENFNLSNLNSMVKSVHRFEGAETITNIIEKNRKLYHLGDGIEESFQISLLTMINRSASQLLGMETIFKGIPTSIAFLDNLIKEENEFSKEKGKFVRFLSDFLKREISKGELYPEKRSS